MTFSPFFFCFTSLFFWVFSLFPSLSPSQPIRLSSPFAMILTSNPFATSKHQTHLRQSLLLNPFATISPNRSPSLPNRSLYSSLLLAHRHFCLPRSLLLAVVAFARCHHICSPSSLKLDRHCRSNPSDILAPSHTDASSSFRRFSSHGPSTSTHTDCSPSLRRFKPQQPFGFHFNW